MSSQDKPDHFFEPVADHLGAAYLRYSFTKGTEQEVDFLVEHLALVPGDRVLDVGCGPGRHAYALARRGISVHGIDISQRFIDLATADAPPGATFARADARAMRFFGDFDAVISLCQGAFGLSSVPGEPPRDHAVLEGMARALAPAGRLAVSAFSAYFQVRYLEDHDTFDADRGVNHERTTIRSEDGEDTEVDLWTTCFTPRELRLLAAQAGLEVTNIYGVTPGRYRADPPSTDVPEFLLVAKVPTADNRR